MAPRKPRRRRSADQEPDPAAGEPRDGAEDAPVSLDAEEHAWWAQRDVTDLWRPRDPPAPAPEETRDILAEHLGADWRTSFGFDPTSPAAAANDDAPPVAPPPDTTDPYAVLGIDERASWEDIVDARRRLAREHHPDRLHGRGEEDLERAESWIRAVNQAFAELKVRRGR